MGSSGDPFVQHNAIGRKLSHYLIERHLGSGGMGEVYLAQDVALGRAVALKILRAGDAAFGERLRREAEAFARLQHPWIATFYEASEDNGLPFLAMEYVPGRTLRRLLGEGSIPVDRALAIAGCLLEALAHAHAAQVLHRDIKPENVMVLEGDQAKLLDFGLAKYVVPGEESNQTQTQLTSAGEMLGTMGYMAPEQLRGLEVDARTDLYAVGAVLHECVAGQPAFPGATPTERMARALTGHRTPLRGPSIPPELDLVVARALAASPGDRFPSASAFLSEVRRLRGDSSASALPDTLAVLDLENVTKKPEDDWMTSGIAESLTSDLARVPGLHVVSREKLLQAKAALAQGGAAVDALDLGHRLACRWVLSGSVQRMGPSLRVVARLTEVPTGRMVASEKVDGVVEGIFDVQDRLAQAVTARLNLVAPSPLPETGGSPDVRAFELTARGRRLTNRLEKGTFQEAQELFEEAIRIDPRNALALSGLAEIWSLRFPFTTDPAMLDESERYARRAIEADPKLGEPYVWLGYVALRRNDAPTAFDAMRRALELHPGLAEASYFSGCAKTIMREHEEAIRYFRDAVATGRSYWFAWLGLGWSYGEIDQMDEALWCIGKALEGERSGEPGATPGAGGHAAECLRRRGDLDAARRSALEGLASSEQTDSMYRDSFRGVCLVSLGRTALRQDDLDAARTAFQQAVLLFRGRPRALGGGHLLVQALAGLAQSGSGAALLDEAMALEQSRDGFNFSWLWCCQPEISHLEMARAANVLGRKDLARRYLALARDAGLLEAKREPDPS
jgi:serine/threonine protein kinase/tetratricopeptide (TPR) repeat protein